MPADFTGSHERATPLAIHFVSHSFAPLDQPLSNVGGMQRVAMDLAAELVRRPDVVLTKDVLRARWDRIAWSAPMFLAGLPTRLARLARAAEVPDVVLFSSITSSIAALPAFAALRARGVRICAIAHGLDVTHSNPAYQLGVRAALSRLDRVLPVSRATEAVCRDGGATDVEVVPNGIALDRFGAAGSLRPAAATDELVVLSVGRHVRRKGFAWFVREVMPRLDPRVRLELVGDGPERECIEHAADEGQVTDRVAFRGLVTEAELAACFARADLFVMPNIPVEGDMEGFGVVLLEAGLAGAPVLAADLEGMRDVVMPGVNGELVPSGEPAAWVEAIERLRVDPVARRSLGAQAADHVRSTFSWPSVAGRYVRALSPQVVPRLDVGGIA